jgi:hypothetical protein
MRQSATKIKLFITACFLNRSAAATLCIIGQVFKDCFAHRIVSKQLFRRLPLGKDAVQFYSDRRQML